MEDKTRGADKTTTTLTTRCSTAHTKHFEGQENIFGLVCVVLYDINHTYMYTCWSKQCILAWRWNAYVRPVRHMHIFLNILAHTGHPVKAQPGFGRSQIMTDHKVFVLLLFYSLAVGTQSLDLFIQICETLVSFDIVINILQRPSPYLGDAYTHISPKAWANYTSIHNHNV